MLYISSSLEDRLTQGTNKKERMETETERTDRHSLFILKITVYLMQHLRSLKTLGGGGDDEK